MKNLIINFPSNLEEAIAIAERTHIKKGYPTFTSVVICGLGGSGIGGKLVASLCEKDFKIPVILCQDYEIPSFVNNKTLVIACSYSGNTEETLFASKAAHQKGASMIAVTTGGKLAEFCTKYNYEHILIPGGNPPRTQLAFSLVELTHIFVQLKLVPPIYIEQFKSAAKNLKSNKTGLKEKGRALAQFIHGKQLIIYSDAKNEAIAIRARQQFNENSKILCSHHVIPEMNHNELVGWAGGTTNHAVLFLNMGDVHPQNEKRFDFSRQVVTSKTPHIFELYTTEGSHIERALTLISILDWASFFLAELNEVDPIEVGIIDKLKSAL